MAEKSQQTVNNRPPRPKRHGRVQNAIFSRCIPGNKNYRNPVSLQPCRCAFMILVSDLHIRESELGQQPQFALPAYFTSSLTHSVDKSHTIC